MKISQIAAVILALVSLSIPACHTHEDHGEAAEHKVVVTSPKVQEVIMTQRYVCQIHSQRHIEVCALQGGYLEAIKIKEGQEVKPDEVMFQVRPILYVAKRDAEKAERDLAKLEWQNTQTLAESKDFKAVVSQKEVKLYEAKLAKAEAKLNLAEAELNFATIKAPFDGIINRLRKQQGSLIKEGEVLTTLSDNSVMWVYFYVPEKQYYEYQAMSAEEKAGQKVELQQANGYKFPHAAMSLIVEAMFNNETGTIPFRADFPNPDRLLRHGMTGNILVHRPLKNALVIPQRATFEILAKRYVYVVDKDDVVHPREIVVEHEQDDIYVIKAGIGKDDKFVYEGVRQVRDGEKVEYEFRPADQILGHQKLHAE